MKKLLYISFLALVAVFFIQCDSVDDLMTENALEGGLVEMSTTAINYVIGAGGTYTFDLFIHQEGASKINTVNIYKSCFYAAAIPWYNPSDTTHATADSVAAKYTDEILEHTISIANTTTSHSIGTLDWGWEELREGLTQEDGNELPADEGSMEIGNYFQFVIEVELSDGRIVKQRTPIKMAVSTRYAGTYVSLGGAYYHPDYWPNAYTSPLWLNQEMIISSVDAITYKWEDWGIHSGANFLGNTLYFQVDPVTNKITYPEEWNGVAQTLNDYPLITPIRNELDMSYTIPLAGPNINTAIPDDVEGKDLLNMVHGYMGTSGPREFYQLLQKVPN